MPSKAASSELEPKHAEQLFKNEKCGPFSDGKYLEPIVEREISIEDTEVLGLSRTVSVTYYANSEGEAPLEGAETYIRERPRPAKYALAVLTSKSFKDVNSIALEITHRGTPRYSWLHHVSRGKAKMHGQIVEEPKFDVHQHGSLEVFMNQGISLPRTIAFMGVVRDVDRALSSSKSGRRKRLRPLEEVGTTQVDTGGDSTLARSLGPRRSKGKEQALPWLPIYKEIIWKYANSHGKEIEGVLESDLVVEKSFREISVIDTEKTSQFNIISPKRPSEPWRWRRTEYQGSRPIKLETEGLVKSQRGDTTPTTTTELHGDILGIEIEQILDHKTRSSQKYYLSLNRARFLQDGRPGTDVRPVKQPWEPFGWKLALSRNSVGLMIPTSHANWREATIKLRSMTTESLQVAEDFAKKTALAQDTAHDHGDVGPDAEEYWKSAFIDDLLSGFDNSTSPNDGSSYTPMPSTSEPSHYTTTTSEFSGSRKSTKDMSNAEFISYLWRECQ